MPRLIDASIATDDEPLGDSAPGLPPTARRRIGDSLRALYPPPSRWPEEGDLRHALERLMAAQNARPANQRRGET